MVRQDTSRLVVSAWPRLSTSLASGETKVRQAASYHCRLKLDGGKSRFEAPLKDITIMVRIGNTASSRITPERIIAKRPVSPGNAAWERKELLIAKPPACGGDGR